MGVKVDMKSLDRFIGKVDKIVEEVQQAAEKTNREAVKEAREIIEFMFRSAVDMYFYDDYEPLSYDRRGTLYNACKVKAIDKGVNIQIKDDGLGRNGASDDYIYTLTLVEGYHGGSKDGFGHPNPGIPYWKKSYKNNNTFYGWYRPAYRSDESTIEKFKEELFRYDFKKMTIDIFNKYCKYKIGGIY